MQVVHWQQFDDFYVTNFPLQKVIMFDESGCGTIHYYKAWNESNLIPLPMWRRREPFAMAHLEYELLVSKVFLYRKVQHTAVF